MNIGNAMLNKVFTKENIFVNAFLAMIIFVVYIIFLRYTFESALITSIIFFGLIFVFDFVIVLIKGSK